MRIGIVTDVHDELEQLSLAPDSPRSEAVEAIVPLGATIDRFGAWDRATEVAALMSAARVVGVWGNHDYDLCREPSLELRARFSPATLEYMATICPQLEVGGCHFSHVEPWLDPLDPGKLWCFEGVPETEDRLRKCFDAVPHRVVFLGHFHRWFAATEDGRLDWDGTTPLHFEPARRYLVVVAPMFSGAFAVIDTDRWVLEPRQLPTSGTRST